MRRILLLAALVVLGGAVSAAAGPRFEPWSGPLSGTAEVIYSEGPAVVRVATAALILSGQSGGSIPLSVLASPLPAADGGTGPVSVLIEIGGSAFAGEESEIDVEVFLYALDAAGDVEASVSQRFRLRRELYGPRLADGLAVFAPLTLAPGSYDLRVLVRRPQSAELGVNSWPLTVPSADDVAPVLLPPWLLAPAAGRLIALPSPASDVAGVTTAPLILLDDAGAGSDPYFPSAAPRLEASRTVFGCLLGRQAPAQGVLTARFELDDGTVAAELTLAPERRPSPWPGLEALWFSLRTPDLPSGRYRLRLALTAAGSEPAESPSVWVEVKAPHAPRVASLADSETAATDLRTMIRSRRLQLPPREIEAGYLRALRRLADGDEAAAREMIADLERQAAGAAPRALDELADVEWRTLAGFAGDSWESLLPVVWLHERLIDDYERGRAVNLAEHSLRSSVRLARELSERASSASARAEAVQALASLGGRLQRAQRLGESDALLERALALDGGHAALSLALAANDERRGDYLQAVEELERLVARHPGHAEGRLRLALNRARVGRGDEALRLLGELTAAGVPEWIAELAFQESARLAVLDGQPDTARSVLERALQRWPRHPTLSIQLASLLDHLGRPIAARERLRVLDRATDAHDSARVRYTEWPDELRQITEPELAERYERRRVELARLLGVVAVTDAP